MADSDRSGKSGKILKTFSSQGISEKQGVFSQNQEKNFQVRELFFKNLFKIVKPFFFRSCQEIALNQGSHSD